MSSSAFLRRRQRPLSAWLLATILGLLPLAALAAAPTIVRVAGGYPGDGGPAASALLVSPRAVAVDSSGNYFIADAGTNTVRRVDAVTGTITRFAGNGVAGFAGDGGAATDAELNMPVGVAIDASGNVYVVDSGNQRVRRIATNGVITTVAGGGTSTADGVPATQAQLNFSFLSYLAIDQGGNLYIPTGSVVRKVDTAGIITTIAGNGSYGYSGDGGAATSAELNRPSAVAVDASGNLYIVDRGNRRIRKVDAAGTITTIAGNGSYAAVTPGPATATSLGMVEDLVLGPAGMTLYFSNQSAIYDVDLANHTLAAFAGGSATGFAGDGGNASTALFTYPYGLALDGSAATLLVADSGNNRIRAIHGGIVNTVAGTTWAGDGNQARRAVIGAMTGMSIDSDGNLYIADSQSARVRRVGSDGVIATVAGNGTAGYSGDNGQAINASINALDVATDANGNLFIADGTRVREVTPAGVITTVAGNGIAGNSGDNGPAVNASLVASTVAVDHAGNVYIASPSQSVVRKVNLNTGIITRFAGTGTDSNTGDGGPASQATIGRPVDLAVDTQGRVFIGDGEFCVLREVDTSNVISTVAGSTCEPNYNAPSFNDGDAATSVQLGDVRGVAVDGSGNLYLSASWSHETVQRISPVGKIYRFAGQRNVFTYTGDGGPAVNASFGDTRQLAVDPAGNVFVGDYSWHVVREIEVDQIFKDNFD